MRSVYSIVLFFAFVLPARAEDVRGWSLSGTLNGSSNSDGVVIRTQPILGYTFNNHLQTYAGLPFYLVNFSSNTASAGAGSMAGIGNAFLGFRLGAAGEVLDYSSSFELTAP